MTALIDPPPYQRRPPLTVHLVADLHTASDAFSHGSDTVVVLAFQEVVRTTLRPRISGIVRAEVSSPAADVRDLATEVAAAVTAAGAVEALLLGYGSSTRLLAALDACEDALTAAGTFVQDVVRLTESRWFRGTSVASKRVGRAPHVQMPPLLNSAQTAETGAFRTPQRELAPARLRLLPGGVQ
ncbi:hypothetical protein Misp03_36170 [Microbispora sp. NBRC 16548]|nr:hypothetical protein Misp03_36170 [Microbispora sp. NBRC 16548]